MSPHPPTFIGRGKSLEILVSKWSFMLKQHSTKEIPSKERHFQRNF